MAKDHRFPHIILRDTASTDPYSPPERGRPGDRPKRSRSAHAAHLSRRIREVERGTKERQERSQAARGRPLRGTYIEVEGESGFDLDLKSLEDHRHKIEVVAVRTLPQADSAATTEAQLAPVKSTQVETADRLTSQVATIFVPQGKLRILEEKIRKYAEETTSRGKPKNQKLMESIAELRLAAVESFWTDQMEDFPGEDEEIWWEVWLRSESDLILTFFKRQAEFVGLKIGDRDQIFLDRRVVLVYGSVKQLTRSLDVVDTIAELRRAKDNPEIYLSMKPKEARDWGRDLLQRIQEPDSLSPALCLLDTGVNAGHPFLEPAIDYPEDVHSADPDWLEDDQHGHGTEMAGLAVYGDMTPHFSGRYPVVLPAHLESVKILPPPPGQNEQDLWGAITAQGVQCVEDQKPDRLRVFSMAVTSEDTRDRGKPSAWSAELDKQAFERDKKGRPRLFFVSAGNSPESSWLNHPEHLDTSEIEDPAQAWNVMTVGVYTERWDLTEPNLADYRILANPGDLSPSTTTSTTWGKVWPLKPDLVFEGGNAVSDPMGEYAHSPDSLSLLTTYYLLQERLLTSTAQTSAANTLVARMATMIMVQYPDLWPETIRALLIHSASWTEAMLDRYGPFPRRADVGNLVRACGYGVPDLGKALWSARNRLTLVAEETLRPFESPRLGQVRMREMNVHQLPWPTAMLLDLGSTEVELRVTLSYFIEPNPGRRGWARRYSYASHGLRFKMPRPQEAVDDFRRRLNKAVRTGNEAIEISDSDDRHWRLGPTLRHTGSIHSDIWKGSAADLADRGFIGVYPVSGWWKERYAKKRWQDSVRYSLVVSIVTPEVDIDIYTPVLESIEIENLVRIEIASTGDEDV